MDSKYKGMTINERLYVSGFSEEFDKAVKGKNIDLVKSILRKVEITKIRLVKSILEQLGLTKK